MSKKVLLIPYVVANGEVLYFVGKRRMRLKKDASKEIWQLPTGKVADNVKNESVICAALRELEEEIGVKRFKNFVNNGYYFSWDKQGDLIKEFIFAIELENEKVKVCSKEFEDYSFLNIDRASKILSYENHKKFLAKVDEDIKSSRFAKIFVICGPGGCGKGSVMDLVQEKTAIKRAKTVTTRDRGLSDSDKCRIFVSKKEFAKIKKANGFIETNLFKGNHYGSPREEIERKILDGESVIIELDLNGLKKIRSIYSNVISIFIYADLKTLEERMQKRGRDSDREIAKRLKISAMELENSHLCDYIIKNENGKLDGAVDQLIKIIKDNTSRKGD